MPLQLDHLILAVNDVEASVDFYTRVLGLTLAACRSVYLFDPDRHLIELACYA